MLHAWRVPGFRGVTARCRPPCGLAVFYSPQGKKARRVGGLSELIVTRKYLQAAPRRGCMTIAQRLIAGYAKTPRHRVPWGRLIGAVNLSRPYGTHGSGTLAFPAMNRWAILDRPCGTPGSCTVHEDVGKNELSAPTSRWCGREPYRPGRRNRWPRRTTPMRGKRPLLRSRSERGPRQSHVGGALGREE